MKDFRRFFFISGDVFNPRVMVRKLVEDGEDHSVLFREMLKKGVKKFVKMLG